MTPDDIIREHSLPAIPTLPPLAMPESHQPRRPGPRRTQSSFVDSSSASLNSHDSFTTAFTSSPHGTPITTNNDDALPHSPSSVLASPSIALRRSFSVDSFVNIPRENTASPAKRTNLPRPSTGGSSSDSRRGTPFEVSEGFRRESGQRIWDSSRNRTGSVSTTGDGYDSSNAGESDLDRTDYLRRTDGMGRMIPRGQPLTRSQIRGGELSLPPRRNALSAASSLSSISNSHPPPDDVHRIHAVASMHSIARNVPPARSRSGSLGMQAATTSRRMMINTSLSPSSHLSRNSEISLLVVGSSGCGKTTVIRKGLKGYGLSDPTTFTVNKSQSGSSRYTRRVGKVTHVDSNPDVPLHIHEAEISLCNLHDDSPSNVFLWPEGAPRIDGVLICYDASDRGSFVPVESLLKGFRAMRLPTVVLACKSDLPKEVEPQKAVELLRQLDVGLVEVNNGEDVGKAKMRRSFDWILKAIFKQLVSGKKDEDRNPASPVVLDETPPWDSSRTATPTVLPSAPQNQLRQAAFPATLPTSPSHPSSPRPSRSEGDLLGREKQQASSSQNVNDPRNNLTLSTTSIQSHRNGHSLTMPNGSTGTPKDDAKDNKSKESRPAQWATLDELLDKLLFLAASGDDPAYITHFLLTYRRFATPRSVLLAMQKRMRQLDNPTGDPMFACFAQMRICHLLELWIRDYPHDFAVRGTQGALSALIKSIISKTYLLHYGSDFLPFLELIPNLEDKDELWALQGEDSGDEDSYSPFEDDDEITTEPESPPSNHSLTMNKRHPPQPTPMITRERKLSAPITAKALVMPRSTPAFWSGHYDAQDVSQKQILKDLQKVAHDINILDSEEIAQEITRIEAKLFLDIEPRHWLQYTLVSGKKDPQTDTIARFNEVSNHLADWVVSLILCHDKPKARARQIEKFVDIAQKLRMLNNYSALRAFVAGINNSTFPGDPTMECFKAKSPEPAKLLQSWDVLLQHIRSHRAYRMALKVTKGACIPALEVHMSDLIRAHEGNPDESADHPGKIHWGKFNMIGKFISSTTQCQAQCRNTSDYHFRENPAIGELVLYEHLMNDEMQKSRIAPPNDQGYDEPHRENLHPPSKAPRKIFPWG